MTEQLPLFDGEVLGAKPSDVTTPAFIAELGPTAPEAAGEFEAHPLIASAALDRSRDEFSLELFP